jgi:UDP-N-acetylglucosamine transferase subunit ALG13
MEPRIYDLKPRILVAPLDWGLGHATRCIPSIRQLMHQKCHVLLGASGRTETLLRTEFPALEVLPLPGYNISYGGNRWESFGKLLLQIPRIIEVTDEEHDWLHRMIPEYGIRAVISDNRYGLFNEGIHSVFITHQLLIKSSLGATADGMLQKLNYEYVNAFNEVWVPDVAGTPNLAADLAHPEHMPSVPVQYLGTLSRLEVSEQEPDGPLLILLSGPEPQRGILENLLLEQLPRYTKPVVFVRGLPGDTDLPSAGSNVLFVNHLPSTELQALMQRAAMVVSRSGYSTIMDLIALGKRSILIPTPGQPEQEYLAQHLMQANLALCIPESKFRLHNAVELAETFNYRTAHFQTPGAVEQAVRRLVETVQ